MPRQLGPPPPSPRAVRANGGAVPLHMMGSSFVRTDNLAAGCSPAVCLITPYIRGLLGGGGGGGVGGLVECGSTGIVCLQ